MAFGVDLVELGQEIIPGLVLTQGHVELIRESRMSGVDIAPNPNAQAGRRDLIDWLCRPQPSSNTRLPRHLEAIWRERDDCQRRFPEVSVGYLDRFGRWLRNVGRVEHASVRLLGYEVPDEVPIPQVTRIDNGVDVVGFFTAEHGVGESARLAVDSLRAVEVAVSTVNYRDTRSRLKHAFEVDDIGRYNTVLCALNAEQLRTAQPRLGQEFFRDKYVIGQWFWELEQTPPWYEKSYPLVNELWASTRFIENSLRKNAPRRIKVVHMPTAIVRPDVNQEVNRESFDLDDRFMFYFSFDMLSVMKRKNPLGLINAYLEAFPTDENTQLVIKTMNGDLRPEEFAELHKAAASRKDITVLSDVYDRFRTNTLMSLADCYVSLHRSEGLGLTIAEAMALGVPVIATGYSGNLDVMGDDHPGLVRWSRVKVGADAEGYPSGATWAEPDLNHAAQLMRQAVEGARIAKADALRRQSLLLQEFGVTMVGERMRARLEEIRSKHRG